MPTIKIPTVLATKISDTNGILSTSSGTTKPSFGIADTNDNANVSRIRIMSGPIPTQNQIDDAYPSWDRFTGSPTEILIDSQTRAVAYFDAINGVITWDLISIVAATSGLASWWIWSGNQLYDPIDRGDAPGAPDGKRLPCIIGDITGLTGGGSMTLVDLNINAGQTYEIGPAQLVMPRTFTYV